MHRFAKFWPYPGLYLTFIGLAPFVLLGRWLLTGKVLFWGTLLTQFWPWHTLVKNALLHGEWPLWTPLLANGTPLLANMQSAVFYPPNWLALLLPVEQFLTLSVALHLALAGWFMFAFARHLGQTDFAATVAALGYMLGGYLVGRTQFITMIHAAAWIPLLLLLTDRLAQRPNWRTGLAMGIVLAVQFLAGHAQLWVYTGALMGGYGLIRCWAETKSWRRCGQFGGSLALAGLLALLLAAVQILPTAELVSQSPRSTGAARYEALTYSFWPWRLITLAAPDFFGNPAQGNYWGYANYWEDHAYAGILPLMAALAGLWIYFRQKEKLQPSLPPGVIPFFALLIPASLLLALGWNTPVYLFLFDHVPGVALFRAPARLLIWYAVALAVLAGAGLQWLHITPKNRGKWNRLLAVCVAITAAGFAAGLALHGRSLTFVVATRWAGVLLTLAIGLLLARPALNRRRWLTENQWQWLVIVFVAADLLLAGWPLLPMQPPAVFTRPITQAQTLAEQSDFPRYFISPDFAYNTTFNRNFQFESFGPDNLDYWQNFKETLVPNFGVYAGLPAANNNDPLVINHWQLLEKQLKTATPPQLQQLLTAMGVQFYIDEANRTGWPEIVRQEKLSIQTVPRPLPRAYFVPRARYATSVAEAITVLQAADFDSRQEVVIIGKNSNAATLPASTPASLTPVTVTAAASQQISLVVTAPTAGFVVLTDTFYPGWQATVDGHPANIWQANAAFRAVEVMAGQHRLVFEYQPRSFYIGLWISAATALATLALIIIAGYRQRQRSLP